MVEQGHPMVTSSTATTSAGSPHHCSQAHLNPLWFRLKAFESKLNLNLDLISLLSSPDSCSPSVCVWIGVTSLSFFECYQKAASSSGCLSSLQTVAATWDFGQTVLILRYSEIMAEGFSSGEIKKLDDWVHGSMMGSVSSSGQVWLLGFPLSIIWSGLPENSMVHLYYLMYISAINIACQCCWWWWNSVNLC